MLCSVLDKGIHRLLMKNVHDLKFYQCPCYIPLQEKTQSCLKCWSTSSIWQILTCIPSLPNTKASCQIPPRYDKDGTQDPNSPLYKIAHTKGF